MFDSNFIQHSVGHSTSFTSRVHCFKLQTSQVQIYFFFLKILILALFSILFHSATTSQTIIKFFSVKNIQPTFAFHRTTSTSFGSSIQVIIFSILSVI
jgi:hypothetical protein